MCLLFITDAIRNREYPCCIRKSESLDPPKINLSRTSRQELFSLDNINDFEHNNHNTSNYPLFHISKSTSRHLFSFSISAMSADTDSTMSEAHSFTGTPQPSQDSTSVDLPFGK
jgi:hypothetical protein